MVAIKTSKNRFERRLQEAIREWDRACQEVKKKRKRMLAQYANGWYGHDNMSRNPMPLNLIDEAISTIAPYIMSHNPRVSISPRRGVGNPRIRAFAKTLELALAHLFEEIQLSKYTLRPVVIDSLFCMGITKTGIMHSHSVEIGGYEHDYGQPYCDRVDFDDYVADVAARTREEMQFEGNRYRLRLDYVRSSGLFDNWDRLKPSLRLYGDNTNPETISKGEYRELHPTVELYDIWLPDDDVIVTIPPLDQGEKFMREVEWDGPEGGPYDVLSYRYFPGSIVPIPPVYLWLDLNKIINIVTNKMRENVEREKTVALYQIDNEDDAERIKNASHGDLVGVTNPDTIREVTYGGFVDKSFMFLQFLLMWANRVGPNLGRIGGGGANAPTLGQEQILQTQALREIDDMVGSVYDFTKSIVKKLAWFLWSDPLIVVPLIKRVADIDVEVEYSEAVKEGDFFDYSFEIEPYSMARLNPEMRYQRLMQLISQIVLPTAQLAASQGNILNVNELVKEAAKYLAIPDIDNWWKSNVPQDVKLGPYQPLQGVITKVKSGQADNRFGLGQTEASRLANLNQEQTRAYQESSSAV